MRKFLFSRIHGPDHDLCIRSITGENLITETKPTLLILESSISQLQTAVPPTASPVRIIYFLEMR